MKRQFSFILTILLLATVVLTVVPGNAGATESVYDAIYRQQQGQTGGASGGSSHEPSVPKEVLPANQDSDGNSEPSAADAPLPAGEDIERTIDQSGQASGEETSPVANGEAGETDSSFAKGNGTWLFIEALLKLVLATSVIVAIIYFGAKFIQMQRGGAQRNQNMQTIGVHALGQNKTLQVIRVADKIYIIGVGENIHLIKELSYEESQEMIGQFQDQIDQMQQPFNGLANQFDRIFKNKLSEFKKKNESPQHDSQDDQRMFL